MGRKEGYGRKGTGELRRFWPGPAVAKFSILYHKKLPPGSSTAWYLVFVLNGRQMLYFCGSSDARNFPEHESLLPFKAS